MILFFLFFFFRLFWQLIKTWGRGEVVELKRERRRKWRLSEPSLWLYAMENAGYSAIFIPHTQSRHNRKEYSIFFNFVLIYSFKQLIFLIYFSHAFFLFIFFLNFLSIYSNTTLTHRLKIIREEEKIKKNGLISSLVLVLMFKFQFRPQVLNCLN